MRAPVHLSAAHAQELCRKHLTRDEGWCVLYCGAVPNIRKTLRDACNQSKFVYAEESFSW